jgi:Tol biopolymer transport system component
MTARLAVIAAAVALAAPAAARAGLVYDKGVSSSHPSVWIANDDGSAPRKLASHGAYPRISPDGQTVVYEQPSAKANQYRPSLMKVPAAGGTPAKLLSPVWSFDAFAWSPDSRTIVTSTGPEVGRHRLVAVDVATGATRTLARGAFFGASFAPNGTAVAYGRAPNGNFPFRGEVFTVPVGGGAPTQITQGGRSLYPVWGPNGIAIDRQRKSTHRHDAPKQDIYMVNPDGTGLRRVTRTRVPFLLTGLQPLGFSADGAHLLAEFGGQDTSYAETVDPVTGAAKVVGRRSDAIVGFRISRDGSTVLGATGGFEPPGPHNVVTIPYAGGRPTVIVRHAYDPDWNR